jgi:hypothetical protein
MVKGSRLTGRELKPRKMRLVDAGMPRENAIGCRKMMHSVIL